MWILLVGLASAEEPPADWGVPTHFPEPASQEQPLPPRPGKPIDGTQVAIGVLGTAGVAALWLVMGLGVVRASGEVRP